MMGRAHVEHIHSPEIDATALVWSGWPPGAAVKILSVDDETGAQSSLVTLPSGYRRPIGLAHAETEALVISGTLRVGETTLPTLSSCMRRGMRCRTPGRPSRTPSCCS